MRIRKDLFFTDANNVATSYCYDVDEDNKLLCLTLSSNTVNFWKAEDREYLLLQETPPNEGFQEALESYIRVLNDLRHLPKVQCVDSDVWVNMYRVAYDGEPWYFMLTPNMLVSLQDSQVETPFVEMELCKEKQDNYNVFLGALIKKLQTLIK